MQTHLSVHGNSPKCVCKLTYVCFHTSIRADRYVYTYDLARLNVCPFETSTSPSLKKNLKFV